MSTALYTPMNQVVSTLLERQSNQELLEKIAQYFGTEVGIDPIDLKPATQRLYIAPYLPQPNIRELGFYFECYANGITPESMSYLDWKYSNTNATAGSLLSPKVRFLSTNTTRGKVVDQTIRIDLTNGVPERTPIKYVATKSGQTLYEFWDSIGKEYLHLTWYN